MEASYPAEGHARGFSQEAIGGYHVPAQHCLAEGEEELGETGSQLQAGSKHKKGGKKPSFDEKRAVTTGRTFFIQPDFWAVPAVL